MKQVNLFEICGITPPSSRIIASARAFFKGGKMDIFREFPLSNLDGNFPSAVSMIVRSAGLVVCKPILSCRLPETA